MGGGSKGGRNWGREEFGQRRRGEATKGDFELEVFKNPIRFVGFNRKANSAIVRGKEGEMT